MLRDPLARIVSDYRYQSSQLNPVSSYFRLQNPDFRTYFSRPHVHNAIAKALLPPPMIKAGNPEIAARFIAERFAFIGMQERYGLSVRTLTAAMGRQIGPTAEIYKTPDAPETRIAVTPDEEADLRHLNAFDISLVRIFAQKWDLIATDLETYLGRMPEKSGAAPHTSTNR